MLELLVLYGLNKSDKTGYGVKKFICENFSSFACPSTGSVHPILKKLEIKKYIQSFETLSEGGRRSVVYSITSQGKKSVNKIFAKKFKMNPCDFVQQVLVRLAVCDMIDIGVRKKFEEESLRYIEKQFIEIDKTLRYCKLTQLQRKLINCRNEEYKNLQKLLSESIE